MSGVGKLPSFQFYPGDWKKDPGVQALDYEARGIWFEMLLMMHESEDRGRLLLNGQAMPIFALANILGIDQAKCQAKLKQILEYGVANLDPETGIISNRRMIRDEANRLKIERLRVIRAEAGRKGGQISSSKKRSKTPAKQAASSSSSSSDYYSKKNNTPLVELIQELQTLGVSEELWNDFVEHRKGIKKPITAVGRKRVLKALRGFKSKGQDPAQIMERTIVNGWTGLFELNSNSGKKDLTAEDYNRIEREVDERIARERAAKSR